MDEYCKVERNILGCGAAEMAESVRDIGRVSDIGGTAVCRRDAGCVKGCEEVDICDGKD